MNRITKALPAAVALAAAACTTGTGRIPDALDPGMDATLAMVVPAKGVQIYQCRVKKGEIDAYEWAFVAPDADLFDSRGKLIGHHGAGPAWQATDGSRVVGTMMARADAPSPSAIPWLLLAAKSDGADGMFSKVTRIQRINTLGGTPPVMPCAQDLVGKQLRIHYTADYRFFVRGHSIALNSN